jgi:hypothetical protein
MNTKNTLLCVRYLFIAIALLLFATPGSFAQNLFYFHDYSGDHLWSNPENWFERLKPSDATAEVGIHTDVIIDEDVDILRIWDFTNCNLTIQSGKKLTVRESISWSLGGIIILEDGAQLLHQEYYLAAKVQKNVKAYDTDTHRWDLIASPIVEDVVPSIENGLLTEPESGFALYTYNEESHLWTNYKETPFSISNGYGYLYANSLDTTIAFFGNVRSCTAPAEIPLSYHTNNSNLAGCNLVGNPFPCNAFVDKSYYILSENSNSLIAVALSSHTPISPCLGIIVKAEEANETVTLCHESPQTSEHQGYIEITAAKSNAQNLILDQALLSFNAGDDLSKLALYEDAPSIYFTKENRDLAILSIDSTGMLPLKFKAVEDGSYTLHFEPKDVSLSYLHLIDNITGINVDLLSTPNYTFNATSNDYASRFKLVFDPHYGIEEDGTSTISETFAYYANGEIIINDVETSHSTSLQIIDMMGHVVVTHIGDAINRVSTNGLAKGVYVLRLNTADGIQMQKIVIQ